MQNLTQSSLGAITILTLYDTCSRDLQSKRERYAKEMAEQRREAEHAVSSNSCLLFMLLKAVSYHKKSPAISFDLTSDVGQNL